MSATHHVATRHSPPNNVKRPMLRSTPSATSAKNGASTKLAFKSTPAKAKSSKSKGSEAVDFGGGKIEDEDEMTTSFLQYW